MQQLLLESVARILRKAGFEVAELAETKPRCFDLVAKRGEELYIIKVLYNVDSLKPETAEEIKKLAKLLSATPIVVGERFKTDFLERGVIYTRCGLPVVSLATFYDYVVEGIPPIVYSAPGGYYVKLDGERIREMRERLGISIGEAAKRLGVSRRTVKKYEEGVDANVEVAMKIEELLGSGVIKALRFESFVKYGEEPQSKIEDEALAQLCDIGLEVYPVKQAPFDAVSDAEGNVILTGVRPVREIERRARLIGEVSRVMESRAAYITDRRVKADIESVVFILRDELSCVSSARDFLLLLEEKRRGGVDA
ncbi:MAG: transcriptional regulator [Archaeoglobaceae archaeon]